MEKSSQSIWKRNWRGPWATLLWIVLLVSATIAIIFGITWASGMEWARGPMILILSLSLGVVAAVLFFYWVRCWRNFRRLLLGLAIVSTLIAVFYVVENVRGKWMWNRFRHKWEAQGEKFDWASFIPPKVPDEQNFAALPIWTNLLRYEWDDEQQREVWRGQDALGYFRPAWSRSITNHPGKMPPLGDWQQQRRTDLVPWQTYYRRTNLAEGDARPIPVALEFPITPQPQTPAADVLLALTRDDVEMKLLREAATRRYVRYPVRYETPPDESVATILLPHLSKAKELSRLYQLQAAAALENGNTDLAFDDIRLGLKLADSSGGDAFVISHLVRIAISQIILCPVWEGLADHKWSDAQLVELENLLGQADFLADHQQGMRSERAMAVSIAEYFMRQRSFLDKYALAEVLGVESSDATTSPLLRTLRNMAFGAAPRGWFYQNGLMVARLHQEFILPTVDEKQRVIKPAEVRKIHEELSRHLQKPTPFNLLAGMMCPGLLGSVKKTAQGQISMDLARVACALERHWLATGTYPESLDALTPKYLAVLPHDTINGQPLRYRRTEDGRFVLYSVGWNERDDGGTIGVKDRDEGDWVWSYTPVPVAQASGLSIPASRRNSE